MRPEFGRLALLEAEVEIPSRTQGKLFVVEGAPQDDKRIELAK